jgi:hypothetical protein
MRWERQMQAESRDLNRNINKIRRDIRVFAGQLQTRIDADEDCSAEAVALMRAAADLRLHLQRRESLK